MFHSFRFWTMLVLVALMVSACAPAASVEPQKADLQPTDRGLIVQVQRGNMSTQVLTVMAQGHLEIQVTLDKTDWTNGSTLTAIELGETSGLVIIVSRAHTFGLIGRMHNRALNAIADSTYSAEDVRMDAIKNNPSPAFVRFFEVATDGKLTELQINPE